CEHEHRCPTARGGKFHVGALSDAFVRRVRKDDPNGAIIFSIVRDSLTPLTSILSLHQERGGLTARPHEDALEFALRTDPSASPFERAWLWCGLGSETPYRIS